LSLGLNAFAVPVAESLSNQMVNWAKPWPAHIFGASAAKFASFPVENGLGNRLSHFEGARKSAYMYLSRV
jgi:hypothetical protein